MTAKTNTEKSRKQVKQSAESSDAGQFVDELEEAMNPVAEMDRQSNSLESGYLRSTMTQDSSLQMGPLSDVLGKAQKAYSAYLEAQKEVAKAYKVNELQLERSYREAQRIAEKACQDAINEALNEREEDEHNAEELLRKTIDQARQMEKEAEESYSKMIDQSRENCEANVSEALQTRDETVNKAWELRSRTVDRAWTIFLRETGTEQ